MSHPTDGGRAPHKNGQAAHGSSDLSHEVLVSLRRIIRAIDLQSKHITKLSGLTTPQVLVMASIQTLGEVTTGRLSEEVSLSQATVTTILDRLEQRGMIERYRSDRDRRVVHARLLAAGREALEKAPPPLHRRFLSRFAQLDRAHQKTIVATLEEVAAMLGAQEIEAAPILDVGQPERGGR